MGVDGDIHLTVIWLMVSGFTVAAVIHYVAKAYWVWRQHSAGMDGFGR